LALQAADVEPPTSVERVRAALDRPAALTITLPEPTPHFRIEVTERRFSPELPPLTFGDDTHRPAAPSWITPGPKTLSGTTPIVGVDLLALTRYALSAISNARRARAERDAHEEVAQALRDFCAVHDCSAAAVAQSVK